MTVFEKEDWKRIVELVTNAKQVVSSVQDVARKLADYAKLRGQTKFSGMFLLTRVHEMPRYKNLIYYTKRVVLLLFLSSLEKLEYWQCEFWFQSSVKTNCNFLTFQ